MHVEQRQVKILNTKISLQNLEDVASLLNFVKIFQKHLEFIRRAYKEGHKEGRVVYSPTLKNMHVGQRQVKILNTPNLTYKI